MDRNTLDAGRGGHSPAVRLVALLPLVVAAALIFEGRERPQPIRVPEAQPQPPANVPAAEPEPVRLPPASAEDVRQAMARVFGTALSPDATHAFATADFNGDGVEDVAVVAKPARGALPAINDELANWILQDPRDVNLPLIKGGKVHPPARRPVRVVEEDALLAIVHGYGPGGWRNSEARQAYLLRSGVGPGLSPRRPADLLPPRPGERLPRLPGDVIAGSLGGREGFLYWTGARYAWHERPRD